VSGERAHHPMSSPRMKRNDGGLSLLATARAKTAARAAIFRMRDGAWLCDVFVHSRFSNTHCAVDQHRLSAQKAVPEYRASGRGSSLK
jgi:hypothetical protein